MAGGKQSPTRLRMQLRRVRVAERRLAGDSERQIAAAVKCSAATAHRDLVFVMSEAVAQTQLAVEQLRALEVGRLDFALRKIWEKIEDGDLEAVKVLVALSKQRAALLGLNVPIESVTQQSMQFVLYTKEEGATLADRLSVDALVQAG
ncbi:unnamed protein product, partial [marine sediment metagenome]